jgi:hypothetical protein
LAADADELVLRFGEPKEDFRLKEGLRPSPPRSREEGSLCRTFGEECFLSGDLVVFVPLLELWLAGLKKAEKKGVSFWVGVLRAPLFCIMTSGSLVGCDDIEVMNATPWNGWVQYIASC